MLATIMAASIVVMALPMESAEASRERGGGDAESGEAEGGDATAGNFESDGDGNEGYFAEGGNAVSGASTAAQIHLHHSNRNTGYFDV
jgi:hypothetical protein